MIEMKLEIFLFLIPCRFYFVHFFVVQSREINENVLMHLFHLPLLLLDRIKLFYSMKFFFVLYVFDMKTNSQPLFHVMTVR